MREDRDFGPMPPRFAEEIADYLQVNGATTLTALAGHFMK